jgi:hypothetical protein
MSTERKYKPFQVPLSIYNKIEYYATQKRQKTGENILWTDILKKCIYRGMKKMKID